MGTCAVCGGAFPRPCWWPPTSSRGPLRARRAARRRPHRHGRLRPRLRRPLRTGIPEPSTTTAVSSSTPRLPTRAHWLDGGWPSCRAGRAARSPRGAAPTLPGTASTSSAGPRRRRRLDRGPKDLAGGSERLGRTGAPIGAQSGRPGSWGCGEGFGEEVNPWQRCCFPHPGRARGGRRAGRPGRALRSGAGHRPVCRENGRRSTRRS